MPASSKTKQKTIYDGKEHCYWDTLKNQLTVDDSVWEAAENEALTVLKEWHELCAGNSGES